MSINLIGKAHTSHLNWLINDWMNNSNAPPVCFLEGFSGTGKTAIARSLLERANSEKFTAVMIVAPETQKDPTDDLLLDLATALNVAGRNELAKAIENNRPLLDVLSYIVNDSILIIIDEFQNTMQGPRPIPRGGFAKVLSGLANRTMLKGRFLLLTNRLVERARWSEPYAIRTVKGMDTDDGMKLLEFLAIEGGRIDEINTEQRRDIVKLVGGNPRAIRTIISNLAYDSLEDLIGNQTELWELHDREISSELIEKLEQELLKKTLGQLSINYVHHLNSLSVIRKPFKRQAIELLFSDKEEYSHFKKEMVDRFLIEQYKGWFSMHPVVREIGLKKLLDAPEDKRKAHSVVAPYYMRHFKAKQIVGWGALGGHFVEARYHIINSGKENELREIATRFKNYIFATLSSTSPIPKKPQELDERIAVLSSLLETPGPKSLEYHLARLFQARNQRNDLSRALHHAQRSKSNFHNQSWLLCSDLLYHTERREMAISTLKEGIKRVPPEKGVVVLYDKCAQLLYEENRQQDAIALLKKGIQEIPTDKAVVNLYERCGRLLYKLGKIEEAINILEDGMERIPPEKAVVTLYTLCGNLLSQVGRYNEAIRIIKHGIKSIPPDYNISDLYYKAGELLLQTNSNQEALRILKDGIESIPRNKGASTAYLHCGELLYQGGRLKDAIILMEDGIRRISSDKGASALYYDLVKLLLISNQQQKAIYILLDGIEKVPINQNSSLIELLLILYAANINEAGIIQLKNELNDNQESSYFIAQALLCQIRELWFESANYAIKAQQASHGNSYLYKGIEAFSWLCAGHPERGLCTIRDYSVAKNILWVKAFIQLRLGKENEAKKVFAIYQKQESTPQYIDEINLLMEWDTPSTSLTQYDLAYYYPILPTSITGLQSLVSRVPYSAPVLQNSDINLSKKIIMKECFAMSKSKKSKNTVFISHSSAQKVHADDLHYMLKQAGYNPILDSYDIIGGQNIPERIATLINECKYFVLLLTEESLKSSWVLSEITLAYSAGLLSEERLLPVQIGTIDDKLANSIPWIPKNSYNWLDGTKGLRPVVEWLDSK